MNKRSVKPSVGSIRRAKALTNCPFPWGLVKGRGNKGERRDNPSLTPQQKIFS
jgi:hypothetical protein